MAFLGDDDYDYDRPRRRSPRGYYEDYRRSGYLDPRPTSGLQRSRSTGHAAAPNIYIYNDQVQDANTRSGSPYPPAPAPPPVVLPGAYPVAVEPPRGRARWGEDYLVDAVEEMRLRSRSRGRSDAAYLEWELQREHRELDEQRKRDLAEKEWELRRLRDESRRRRDLAEREEARKRYERELELKQIKDEAARRKRAEEHEAEEKRILADYEEKKRKADAAAKKAEQDLIAKMEREKKERAEEEQRIREKIKKDEEEAKEKKKREYEAFLAEQKARKEKEEAEKKAEKEKLEREMRKRLEAFGVYSQAQIDYMINEENAKKAKEKNGSTTTTTTTQVEIWQGGRRPVYPKVHRDYLSIDTLIYYKIPWEYDPYDPNYIIIRREMDKYETDVLFEHTRRIRAGTLLIEEPKKEKNYAWYRKKDGRSRSRSRVGILEVKRVV